MKKSFELHAFFETSPEELYHAWLDSFQHSEMTGAAAECSDLTGAGFTAWDTYISGKNLQLRKNREIIQSWRTTGFNDNDEDSEITIRLKASNNGTELTLIHKNIPENDSDYAQGWIDYYFTPMKEYFKKK